MEDGYLVPLSNKINGIFLTCGKKIIVGRNIDATHYILSKNVSKEHLSLQQDENENWTIMDLKSLNGTTVNDVRLTPFQKVKLDEGDVIDIVSPYRYKFTKRQINIDDQKDKRLRDSLVPGSGPVAAFPTLTDFKKEELKRPTLQSSKGSAMTATVTTIKTDCHGDRGGPSLKRSKLCNSRDVVAAVSDNAYQPYDSSSKETKDAKLGTVLRDDSVPKVPPKQAPVSKSSRTYRAPMNISIRLTNQLKSEIVAKDELISVLRKESATNKDKWDKERSELVNGMKSSHALHLAAKESQIKKLLEEQKGMVGDMEAIRNAERRLCHEIDELTKHQKILSSGLERRDKELSDLKVSKETLEKELAGFEVERLELLKNFETSFGTESKLNGQRIELMKQIWTVVESEFQCVICHELLIKATVMNCGHIFCGHCLTTWLQTKKQCPVCRKPYHQRCSLLLLDNYLDTCTDKFADEELRKKRAELKVSREQRASIVAAAQRMQSTSSRGRMNAGPGFDVGTNPLRLFRRRRRPTSLHFGTDTYQPDLNSTFRDELIGAEIDIVNLTNIIQRYARGAGIPAASTSRPTAIPSHTTANRGRIGAIRAPVTQNQRPPYTLRSSGGSNVITVLPESEPVPRTVQQPPEVITVPDGGRPTNAGMRYPTRRVGISTTGTSDVIYIDYEGGADGFTLDLSGSDFEVIGTERASVRPRRRNNRASPLNGPPRSSDNVRDTLPQHPTTSRVRHDVSDNSISHHFIAAPTDDLDDDITMTSSSDDLTSYEGTTEDDSRSSPPSRGVRDSRTSTRAGTSARTSTASTSDGRIALSSIICPKCRSRGHISRHCPRNQN